MRLLEYLERITYTETEDASKIIEPRGNSGTAVYSSDWATTE